MPLYGFVCEHCAEEFEELVITSERVGEVACPKCGSGNVERQLSLVAALPKSTEVSGYCPTNPDCTTSGCAFRPD